MAAAAESSSKTVMAGQCGKQHGMGYDESGQPSLWSWPENKGPVASIDTPTIDPPKPTTTADASTAHPSPAGCRARRRGYQTR